MKQPMSLKDRIKSLFDEYKCFYLPEYQILEVDFPELIEAIMEAIEEDKKVKQANLQKAGRFKGYCQGYEVTDGLGADGEAG